MISLKNITVRYGDNVIYDDFSFDFPQGVNVVLGESGSGKTTLLNVICSLVPYEGECNADKASVVFQKADLAPVSALNNVASVLTGKDAKSRAQQMLGLCQIGDKANVRATKLSVGEQQRVALARAFVTDRKLLLLDEPFNSLDLRVKLKLYQTLSDLLQKFEKTVLLVTHDIDEALLLADRVYLLSERPCNLEQVAQLATPRADRSYDSEEISLLRKKLRMLFSE